MTLALMRPSGSGGAEEADAAGADRQAVAVAVEHQGGVDEILSVRPWMLMSEPRVVALGEAASPVPPMGQNKTLVVGPGTRTCVGATNRPPRSPSCSCRRCAAGGRPDLGRAGQAAPPVGGGQGRLAGHRHLTVAAAGARLPTVKFVLS